MAATVAVWTSGLAILLALSALARADTIYLRGGEKVIGKVITDERTKVVIESQTLGRLTILRERIERIELDPPPAAQLSPSKQIITASHDTASGVVAPSPSAP